ncbi:hypothetical protein FOZ63_034163 [Perkinsus olseni]|uniref:Uncharacterized protein n=1 Tax=Perkinsus olseni TaxID=32597 RepID=A0A7J6STW0_PEROL|nr:hypothetical protein FOZ62_030754 [Perkinsus olseni]KAF4736318.1 hypothetical protein FOZ63_034163 [Perkinsus olseni]
MAEPSVDGPLPNLSDLWGSSPDGDGVEEIHRGEADETQQQPLGALDSLFAEKGPSTQDDEKKRETRGDQGSLPEGIPQQIATTDMQPREANTTVQEGSAPPAGPALAGEGTAAVQKPPTPPPGPVIVEEASTAVQEASVPLTGPVVAGEGTTVVQEATTSPTAEERVPCQSPGVPSKAMSGSESCPTFKYDKMRRPGEKGRPSALVEGPWATVDISRINVEKHKSQRTYFSSPTVGRGRRHLIRKDHRDAARRILEEYRLEKSERLRSGAVEGNEGLWEKQEAEKADLLTEQGRLRTEVSELKKTIYQLRKALSSSVELLKVKNAEVDSLRALLGPLPPTGV